MKQTIRDEIPGIVTPIVNGVVQGLKDQISKLQSDNQKLTIENHELKARVAKLESLANSAEQYSRRNSLSVSGIPESLVENTDEVVLRVADDIESGLVLSEIDRSHLVGKPKVGKPRDILIKFATYRSRKKMYKKRTLLKDKGHPGVFLNEDLTKSRMDLLYKARGKVKGTLLLGAWSSDGVILVKDNEGRVHRITSEGDLIDFNTPRPKGTQHPPVGPARPLGTDVA